MPASARPSRRARRLAVAPNAWQRDTAQRFLVERRDMKSVAALRHSASAAQSPLGRIHALWTLEGIDAGLNEESLLHALRDPDSRVRVQALILMQTRERGGPSERPSSGWRTTPTLGCGFAARSFWVEQRRWRRETP